MPPNSPSAQDDALDFDGLDLKPSGAKTKAAESDFEKELEALFADELASSDETPASAPPVGAPVLEPVLEPVEEDALLLDDLVQEAPVAAAAEVEGDILDLSAFEAGGELDLTPPEDASGGKNGDIDLGGLDDLISGLGESKAPAPAAGKPAPQEAAPLDDTDMADLLGSLDVPAAEAKPAASPPEDEFLELSLGDLVEPPDEALDLAAFAAPSQPSQGVSLEDLTLPDLSDPDPGRDLIAEQEKADLGGEMDLGLGGLLPEPGLASGSAASDSATSMDQLLESEELNLDGLMEGIEPSAGETQNLSIDPQALLAELSDQPPAEPVQLEPSFAPAAEPSFTPAPELPAPELFAAPAEAPVPDTAAAPALDLEPLGFSLPEAALGVAAMGAAAAVGAAAASLLSKPTPEAEAEPTPAAAPAAAAPFAPAAPSAFTGMSAEAQAEIKDRLSQLAAQVTGNSVAVMRLEGQLVERDKTMAEMERRLLESQQEAKSLRDDLASLRALLESSLRTQAEEVKQEVAQGVQASAAKSQAAMDKALGAMDKALAALDKAHATADKVDSLAPRVESAEMTVRGAGARLAQMEDRQSQLDREVFAEISRAVPREAAKVIREEIAHLAASLHEE